MVGQATSTHGGKYVYRRKQLQFHPAFQKAGLRALVGMGLDPGMSTLTTTTGGRRSRIDKAGCSCPHRGKETARLIFREVSA